MITTHSLFNLSVVDPSWKECILQGLTQLDPHYLEQLYKNNNWLPGHERIFNAFSLPVEQVNYILFGESPYPRAASANGYAFWDQAVTTLWSPTGLSKAVNRATSLRNIIKMLLIAEDLLDPQHTTQPDIAKIPKHTLVQSNQELFTHFLQHGFLLLNASLVLRPTAVRQDALAWHPFIQHVLAFLLKKNPHASLILLGSIANTIDALVPTQHAKKLYAEHPYNLSFIHNPDVLNFFRPLHVLRKNSHALSKQLY